MYLLDAFNSAPDVSNWVTAGDAMNTIRGKGISVVAPARGAYSLYTNWEQDGTSINGALHDGMMQYGGADANQTWGPRSSAGGSGTTRTCTINSWQTTTLGCGSTVRRHYRKRFCGDDRLRR